MPVANSFAFTKLQSRIANALLLVGLAILLFTVHPGYKNDGQARYDLLVGLVYGTDLTEKYSLFMPVLSIPIFLFSKLVGINPHVVIPYFNLGFTIVIGYIVMRLSKQRFGQTVTQIAALLLLAASMFAHHLQWYYGEVSHSLLFVLAYFLKDRYRWLSAALVGLAIWSTPAFLPIAGVTALVELWFSKFKNFRLIAASAFGLGLIVAENLFKYHAFSSPYLSSQEPGGFSVPTLLVFLAVLFSFGKGIFVYMPSLFLLGQKSIANELSPTREDKWVNGTFTVALILTYSAWWAWYGGWYWGPRFFLVLCFPAVLALAMAITKIGSTRMMQIVVLGLLAYSLWVGVEGYVFGQADIADTCKVNNYARQSLCWYTFEYSALWHPFLDGGLLKHYALLEIPKRVIFAFWQIAAVGFVALSAWQAGRTLRVGKNSASAK